MSTRSVLLLLSLLFSPVALADDMVQKSPRVTAEVAWEQIHAGALVVDVRSADEFASGHIEGALNIPHDQIAKRMGELGSDRARKIVLYCRSGKRAGVARDELVASGFTAVANAGGYEDLKAFGAK